jgi:hypothetical protein
MASVQIYRKLKDVLSTLSQTRHCIEVSGLCFKVRPLHPWRGKFDKY